MSVRPGTRLDGRYRLAERLAYGGMGEVWRATDEVLSREVAVKILRPELAEDEAFVRRFRAEARTTSGLPHNGIAAVYDYGETRVGADGSSPARYDDEDADPVAYLVMELVPGEALSSILSRDGALSPDRTLDLVAQAARALHAAHLRGVIHRDIKPANLMVTPDGRVKVTDFGIARPLDHEPLTATGQVMGTAHYLAPELAKGQDASPLSDVYALGVVAYECLAGHRPFEGDNQVAVALAHLNEQPDPLPAMIPGSVRAVVGAAMEKDPNRRMPSAESFAAALETVRYNGPDSPNPAAGVLPGSSAAEGLAAAGLLGPAERGWTPGLPQGREMGPAGSVGVAPPPVPDRLPPPGSTMPGTHVLAPDSPFPRTGSQAPATAGAAYGEQQYGNGYGGAYPSGSAGQPMGGYGGPSDPFRTQTAPGGISVTPGGRSRERSLSGPALIVAVLIVAAALVLLLMWVSGLIGGGGSGTTTIPTESPTAATSSQPSAVVPPSSSSSTSRSSTTHRASTTTRSRTTSPTTSSTSQSTSTSDSTSTSAPESSDTGSPTATPTSSGSATSSPPTTSSSSALGGGILPGRRTSTSTPAGA